MYRGGSGKGGENQNLARYFNSFCYLRRNLGTPSEFVIVRRPNLRGN